MTKKEKQEKAAYSAQQETEPRLKVVKRPLCKTRLAKFVESHGIKLSWIARELDMSYSRLYRFTIGETEPKVSEGHSLSRLLNCRLEDIFELNEPENNGDNHLKKDELTKSPTLSGNCSSEYCSGLNSSHLLKESDKEEQNGKEKSSGS